MDPKQPPPGQPSHRFFHMNFDWYALPFLVMTSFALTVSGLLFYIVAESPHLLSKIGDPRDERQIHTGACIRELGDDDQWKVMEHTHTHTEIKNRLYGTRKVVTLAEVNRFYIREQCIEILRVPKCGPFGCE
jgi:hypothetical protein